MNGKPVSLITGANGHLGNNLVRHLLAQGETVRASVRNLKSREPFAGLDCELVPADITDKSSLLRAMQGVTTLYAVGAAFKLWAKDEEKEIYEVNMQGTRNIIEAAAEAGVRKVVYVSSIAALNYATLPSKESYGFNPDRRNAYYRSKNDAEQLALALAKEHNLRVVTVLPSAMIGSEAFTLSESFGILKSVYDGNVPIETSFTLNWIDVKDVAAGCYAAAQRGVNGRRYILANEKSMTLRETTTLTMELFPERGLKIPPAVPKAVLYAIAFIMEQSSRFTGKPPLLRTNLVSMLFGVPQDFDISQARRELGFTPKSPDQAVREALLYLKANYARLS
ncbi:NAD-dependent epimerase/dehydratase family protein [Fibrella aquatilis]|uniref:NAD-dependent epimerase/dehydratase family protein n=1 Tax=Fibrella aquatilis TaxID=2817059 RepID=A0A939G403_9BACT|nr:NAD-dependent epimerase/dehydratase family protein [Fibrella aquatilis]MBO0931947.1 NAD-dependent epimerase/dehydratase family protein [Fibrella aquatilis]